MRYILFSTILALSVLSGLHQSAFAVCTEGPTNTFTCDTNPPNPDPVGIQQFGNNANLNISVLPGAGIDTTILAMDDDGIETGDGMNEISVDGGSIIGEDNGIRTGQDIDRVVINNAVIHGLTNDTIDLQAGNDVLDIVDSTLTAVRSNLVRMHDDDDTVHITGSELKVLTTILNARALNMGDGNDNAFVEDSLLQGAAGSFPIPFAIDLADDNDTLTIGNGVVLKGLLPGNIETVGVINCADGFDTIIFAMDVPPELLNKLSGEILLAGLPDGSITINGLFYEWINCELLVNELVGVRVTRPVPTLSQWGAIAMAGVLGFIGFIAVRKKAVRL